MKKMRKLIPAISMLLIATIMLSTATFAWFTMNEQVTATGMQVQAKASGNLLISANKMDATAKDFSVNLGGTKKDLVPITLTKGTDNKWQVANGNTVDPTFGNTTAALQDVADSAISGADSVYFSEYVVYLATAGDAFSGKLQLDFNAIANYDGAIANAYTLALYVVDTEAELGGTIAWNQPDYVYNVEDTKNPDHPHWVGNTGYVNTNVTVNVPSTYGTTASTAVGLKVIIRIYVDGALTMPGVTETVKYIIPVDGITAGTNNPNTSVDESVAIEAITTYDHDTMSGYTFYADLAGLSPKTLTAAQDGVTFEELGVVAYYNGTNNTIQHPEATYVNNTTVPSAGTSFSIDFKVEKATQG